MFHLIYCAKCNTLFNVTVVTHYCKVINAQRTIPISKFFLQEPPA